MSLIEPSVRIKPYRSIYNFRDFGGYRGLNGRVVKSNLLFRSAHLNNLVEDEIASISELPIGLVVDLRHGPERVRQPSKWPVEPSRGVDVLTLPTSHARETAKVAPHEAFVETKLETPEDARDYMMRSYAARPDDEGFKALFRDTLISMTDGMGNEPKGVLIHCAAGKDRTGTLCALILGLLGVSQEDVMADYMLTRDAVDIEAILQPAAAMFSKRYGREIDADAIRPMFGVEEGFLRESFRVMGDAEAYSVSVLGLEPERIDVLRSSYLVP